MWTDTVLSGLWAFSPRQRIYTPIYTSTRDKKQNKLKQKICMSVDKTKRKRREERSMERWCHTSFPPVLTVNFRKCLWKSGGASLLLPMIWGLCLNPIFWCQNHTVVRQQWRQFCFTSDLVPEIYTVCSKLFFFFFWVHVIYGDYWINIFSQKLKHLRCAADPKKKQAPFSLVFFLPHACRNIHPVSVQGFLNCKKMQIISQKSVLSHISAALGKS